MGTDASSTRRRDRGRGARPRLAAGVGLTAVALAVGAVLVPVGATQPATAAPGDPTPIDPLPTDPAPPNIVLVMMDDMRVDDLPWLPVVQREIYDRGVSYSNFYAPTSLCCPSRASVLRGQYPHNSGIRHNTEPAGGFEGSKRIDDQTLATWLDPTYQTGYVGKYFNGYEGESYIPPGWDDWLGAVHTYRYLHAMTNHNGVFVDDAGRYSSDVFGDQAAGFIEANAVQEEPYFLHVSFVTPHGGTPSNDGDGQVPSTPYVPPEWQGTYSGPRFVEAPSFNEPDTDDKTGPVATKAPLTREQRHALAVQTAQRREALLATDAAVGRVLAAVDASGEGESTYVIFTSDNGNVLGEHRYTMNKILPYEPASRLPFAVRGPGLEPGTTYPYLAGTMDVAPTVLGLAGVDSSLELDGHSVLPGAQPRSTERDRAVLLMATIGIVDPENGGDVLYAPQLALSEERWKYRGVVTRRWKLIRWVSERAWELYDLRRDPDELTNLSAEPRWNSVEQQLRQRLAGLWGCEGRACDG